MRGRLGELREAPWTLWAYVLLSTLASIVSVAVGDPVPWWSLPLALAVGLFFDFFLLRGSRFVWWLVVVLGLGSIPFSLMDGNWWWWVPLTILQVGLLLAPDSRRHTFPPKRPQEKFTAGTPLAELGPQTSWNPDDHGDATRPPGWYLDPDDPSRMRYWHPSLGGWQSKTTRAPRNLRRSREPTAD